MVIPATHRRARVSPLAPRATIGSWVGPFADPPFHSAIHLYFTSPMQFRLFFANGAFLGLLQKRDACANGSPISALFSLLSIPLQHILPDFYWTGGRGLGTCLPLPQSTHPLPLPTFLIIIATLPHKQPPFHIGRESRPMRCCLFHI